MAGGFLDTPRRSPLGMGLVIALHVGVLGAVILAPAEFIKVPPIVTVLQNYKDPPPPPPIDPAPQSKQQPRTETRPEHVVTPVRIVETNLDPVKIATVDLTKIPTLPDGPIAPPPQPITTRDPVTVEPQVDPRFARNFQPPYPSQMARQEIEGKAIVRVLVGIDGRVKAVEAVSGTDLAFLEATLQHALRAWRFKPATRDGVPIESWRTMTVRFQMEA